MTEQPTLLAEQPTGAVATVAARPGISHVRRTLQRYSARLGNQFAAAITYFLVLAMVPILMFAFATLGFVLDVLRPELIPVIEDMIGQVAPGQDQLIEMLRNFLANWPSVGIFGVLSALYTAQGFIGNFTDAVQAQLTSTLDDIPKLPFIKRFFKNVLVLIGVLVLAAITLAATIVGTGLASQLAAALALPGWAQGAAGSLGVVVTVVFAWVLFIFIFTLVPAEPVPKRTRIIGAVVGAVALTVLVNLATVLISLFSHSPTAALFGPIIAIMLSLNFFARTVLIVAAWMGTAEAPATAATRAEAAEAQTERAQARSQPPTRSALGAIATGTVMIGATILGYRGFGGTGAQAQTPASPRFSPRRLFTRE